MFILISDVYFDHRRKKFGCRNLVDKKRHDP